eukprot:CAMPEP_0176492754 /NCGR_PEP_ID=MMETSP0200_2-20121128/9179_1 /TAXON_ID=947934 /ORGANISM="Chaetoceros sp., Strain GSL56" /LENGTH=502 /DNA_ID=CAMNT_0017890361 /DNA_START=170 /DNA_END=1678 /DNA_ORIENTATION=-
MWGEGPGDSGGSTNRNKPPIPSRNPGTDSIRVDGDGRRIRGKTAAESDTFSSSGRSKGHVYDDWGNDVRESPRKNNERDDFDDEWGETKVDDWGGGQKNNAGRKKEFNNQRSSKSKSFGNNHDRRGSSSGYDNKRGGYTGRTARDTPENQDEKDASDLKINLKALEKAGFVHLYGLAPVINALTMKKRDLVSSDSYVDLELLDGQDLQHEIRQRERKPEAQYTPWLFIQENMKFGSGGKTGDKAAMAKQVEILAKESNVPVAYVDKGVLNTLCGSRPHQGYVLRCGQLDFEPLSRIPHPTKDGTDVPSLWLALDEVVDPQNFGALLRSAYFLGGNSNSANSDNPSRSSIGVLVCSKNSAPPSPVVSAASAGALELCQVYSTSNLPRTLNAAKEDGWRILGAAASAPIGMVDPQTGEAAQCCNLRDVNTDDESQPPTILVLGSEGHGLRTLVAKACTGFIRIPKNAAASLGGGDVNTNAGVDSLNVSVTGGIMLWHFLNDRNS